MRENAKTSLGRNSENLGFPLFVQNELMVVMMKSVTDDPMVRGTHLHGTSEVDKNENGHNRCVLQLKLFQKLNSSTGVF